MNSPVDLSSAIVYVLAFLYALPMGATFYIVLYPRLSLANLIMSTLRNKFSRDDKLKKFATCRHCSQ